MIMDELRVRRGCSRRFHAVKNIHFENETILCTFIMNIKRCLDQCQSFQDAKNSQYS